MSFLACIYKLLARSFVDQAALDSRTLREPLIRGQYRASQLYWRDNIRGGTDGVCSGGEEARSAHECVAYVPYEDLIIFSLFPPPFFFSSARVTLPPVDV